jgi:hypothetical protein
MDRDENKALVLGICVGASIIVAIMLMTGFLLHPRLDMDHNGRIDMRDVVELDALRNEAASYLPVGNPTP